MSRRRFNERDVIETLAWQGVWVACFRCKKTFFEPAGSPLRKYSIIQVLQIEREHLHEYELGGADAPYNCRYSCKECHARITNGTKATSVGSSKHKMAKVRRIRGETKGRPKRDWPKGPKMKSRPFRKRKP